MGPVWRLFAASPKSSMCKEGHSSGNGARCNSTDEAGGLHESPHTHSRDSNRYFIATNLDKMPSVRQHSAGCLSYTAACNDLARPFPSLTDGTTVSSESVLSLSPALPPRRGGAMGTPVRGIWSGCDRACWNVTVSLPSQ